MSCSIQLPEICLVTAGNTVIVVIASVAIVWTSSALDCLGVEHKSWLTIAYTLMSVDVERVAEDTSQTHCSRIAQ
jgi:hypothetical protein